MMMIFKKTKTQTQRVLYGVSTCPYCNSTVYDKEKIRNLERLILNVAQDLRRSMSSQWNFAKAWWLNSKDCRQNGQVLQVLFMMMMKISSKFL